MLKKISYILFSVALLSCSNQKENTTDPLVDNLDTSIHPGEDFFLYANNGWIKNNPIPEAESSWGIGQLVQEDIYKRLITINENAIKEKASVGSVTQKIADFWSTAMDTVAINKSGLNFIQKDLDKIKSANNVQDVMKLSAEFGAKGSGTFFGSYIGQDDMNSEKMAFILYQGGLGMPNRDYYFNTDEKSIKVQNAFKEYLVKTFVQLGNTKEQATIMMNEVYTFETNLAKASRKLADLRDPYKNYNKMSVSKLETLAPNVKFTEYFKISGINNLDSVIVGQPEFYTALNTSLTTTPLQVLKNYMLYNYVADFANYLDDETYMNKFNYSKTLSGATTPRPRWKRMLDAQENAMGEALGQLFVKEYFNETAKKRYEGLVEAIREALKERIEKLSWMSNETKTKAYDKLAKMKKKVGYPDKWKDFSAMQISKNSFIENVQNANLWWHNYSVNKLGKPVNRDEWDMTPQTYNAYYNPSNNEIVLPAGIFAIPGKKDAELDDALVYGYAAASTIGHEITHGFDDQGRQYDAAGNLTDWWTKKDGEEFKERAKKIIQQFNEFVPVDTLHINGEATQGENIADLGGVLLGLDAFKKTEAYKSGKKIGGLTPLQRYFLGYGYSWMYQARKERLANQVKTDVHSPAKERINGPVVNVPEFYEAFGVKPGDKMYRADSLRVKIW
ncbi:MAG: M13 family metallopeptidase [Chitinophagaceae bacterium]|nr:M13 family metallopeptidase [Chitinophagaceae bacterium]